MGGVHHGRRRYDDLADPELGAEPGAVQRSGAAVSVEREVARVVSFVDGELAQRIGHLRVDDPSDAGRRGLDVQAEWIRDVLLGRPRCRVLVQAHAAAEEPVGIQVAEDEVCVRDRGP